MNTIKSSEILYISVSKFAGKQAKIVILILSAVLPLQENWKQKISTFPQLNTMENDISDPFSTLCQYVCQMQYICSTLFKKEPVLKLPSNELLWFNCFQRYVLMLEQAFQIKWKQQNLFTYLFRKCGISSSVKLYLLFFSNIE